MKIVTIHLTLSMSERTQIKTDKHVFFLMLLDGTTLSKLIHIKIGSLHEIHPCIIEFIHELPMLIVGIHYSESYSKELFFRQNTMFQTRKVLLRPQRLFYEVQIQI